MLKILIIINRLGVSHKYIVLISIYIYIIDMDYVMHVVGLNQKVGVITYYL